MRPIPAVSMQLPPRQAAGLAFFFAAALSIVAGALPWIRGRGPNAAMLALAVVWFVLGAAMFRRER
jgi:hypothetical protein